MLIGNNWKLEVGRYYIVHESSKLCFMPHNAIYQGDTFGRHSFLVSNFRESGTDVLLTAGESMLEVREDDIYLNDNSNAHWSWKRMEN